MGKLSRKTLHLYNYALISLMTGFGFIYMFMRGEISGYSAALVAVPAICAGIYFLATGYHRSKKEL